MQLDMFARFCDDCFAGFYRFRKPYVTADNAVAAYLCVAAEYRSSRVDDYIVSDIQDRA